MDENHNDCQELIDDYTGDGWCDEYLNCALFDYDGGDCYQSETGLPECFVTCATEAGFSNPSGLFNSTLIEPTCEHTDALVSTTDP